MTSSLPFDKVPFTRYGSYFAVSMEPDGEIYIRDLHGGDMAPTRLYKLRYEGADAHEVISQMSESRLEQTFGCGICNISIGKDDTLHINVKGGIVHLEAVSARYDSLISLSKLCWEHQFYSQNTKIAIAGKGTVYANIDWRMTESENASITLDGRQQNADCVLKSYKAVPTTAPKPDFNGTAEESAKDYSLWLNGANIADGTTRLAHYILWGNFVRAEGCLRYDAMYMNKLAMGNIWSWDNCFGAIALARTHPETAFEQIKVLFECQDASGVLPDYINDTFASYSCTKPPIYGFTAVKLRERSDYFKHREVTKYLYDKISQLTGFWCNHRIDEHLCLPRYYHGNDSGWDNASVFHAGVPVCSPDLSAYLILQMDTLAELACELDRKAEETEWKRRADKLFSIMMERLHINSGFVTLLCEDGSFDTNAKSLLNLLPVVIWYRLSNEILAELVSTLEKSFEQEYGLSTESPSSVYYKKGGYWLGPIWAPVSYIFIDSLRKAKYENIATRLAEKFHKLPQISGMAENFDPVTGEGYDDNAFAWTASVYLTLKDEY